MLSDEYAEVISYRERAAGKPHKCRECARVIGIGEQHIAEVLKFDGEIKHIEPA